MDKLERIIELLDKVENMSIRKYPRTNIPFDLDVWIEMSKLYELLDEGNKEFVKDLMSDNIKWKIRVLGHKALEKSFEIKNGNFLRIALMAHIFEDFQEPHGHHSFLTKYFKVAKSIGIDISKTIDSLKVYMTSIAKENVSIYINYHKENSLDNAILEFCYREDGSVEIKGVKFSSSHDFRGNS